MVLMTLRRNAPEAVKLGGCSVCGREDPAGAGDHLMMGQPGNVTRDFCLCRSCGDVLATVVHECGSDLTFIVQQHKSDIATKSGLPHTRQGEPARPDESPRAQMDETRRHLQQEVRVLAHAEQTLRAEVKRLEQVE